MRSTQNQATSRSRPWTRRRPAWVIWSSLALAIATAVVISVFIGRAANDRPVTAAYVQDVLASPEQYLDQRIVVGGRVDELLTHRALTLGSESASGSLPVLVEKSALVNGYDIGGVVPLEHGQLYQEQEDVQFVGTLETFDRESLETQMDIVLNEQLFGELEGRPVLLVDRLDGAALGLLLPDPPTLGG